MVPRFPGQAEKRLETLSLADLVEEVCRPEAGDSDVDVERQALQARLQVAFSESLREDVEYLRVCLTKIASSLTRPNHDCQHDEAHAEHGKWLFPIPVSNQKNGNLELRIRTLILEQTQDGEVVLQQALRQFTDFSRVDSRDKAGSWLNFPARVNLLKALTVFLDQMAGRPAAAEEGLSVDYPRAARLLHKMEFLPAVSTETGAVWAADKDSASGRTNDQATVPAEKEKLQSWREELQSFLLKKAGWITIGDGAGEKPSDPSCGG